MSKQEINQYLTEQVFQECWHERDDAYLSTKVCIKCNNYYPNNNNFFSLEGCMQLWLEIQGKEWLMWFRDRYSDIDCGFDTAVIHPDRLAPAVYEFLKARGIVV